MRKPESWAAAESQWYAEPKRLEQLGLLRSPKQPGRATPRTERALLAVAKEQAETLPHREKHLRLVHRLRDLLLDAHGRWLEDVERELAQP